MSADTGLILCEAAAWAAALGPWLRPASNDERRTRDAHAVLCLGSCERFFSKNSAFVRLVVTAGPRGLGRKAKPPPKAAGARLDLGVEGSSGGSFPRARKNWIMPSRTRRVVCVGYVAGGAGHAGAAAATGLCAVPRPVRMILAHPARAVATRALRPLTQRRCHSRVILRDML